MARIVRCQAVILKDNRILVLRQYNYKRHEEYWMLPGGNLEHGETEEEAIKRELKEETNLEVEIEKIIFDEPSNGIDEYQRYITFLCTPIPGSVESIGSETVSFRKILELVWVSLSNEKLWNEYMLKKQFYPSMNRIKDGLKIMNGLKSM
ncbi:NUDIX hydrolase [Clostridium bowmanii]|uniref:NUDIX domain-containing protein n=1 Tax=Clostridium bowmanii TaxID=132925 RepID=UPI001C0C83E2|nr:NUDIX hydrolase [Clostridium bowmanii]MBU3191766.1 NUDIX hydrolase [Clostridium bowmanii]MCA1075939.1 NUDIX hydrolase [Clostridium bowmanii]